MIDHYILLPDHSVKVEPDFMEWARWFESADRVVKKTFLQFHEVSTVFLGLDHGFHGKTLLFETMVFSRETYPTQALGREMEFHESFDQVRYSTWDEAVSGHGEIVEKYLALETSSGILSRKIIEKSC